MRRFPRIPVKSKRPKRSGVARRGRWNRERTHERPSQTPTDSHAISQAVSRLPLLGSKTVPHRREVEVRHQ